MHFFLEILLLLYGRDNGYTFEVSSPFFVMHSLHPSDPGQLLRR